MRALDTNVIIRLIMDDDKKQSAAVLRILQDDARVLLLNTVVLESVWVLQAVYDASREDVCRALTSLLAVTTPESPAVRRALEWFRDGMDFADALHLATAVAGRYGTLYSFDRQFLKSAKGRSQCLVAEPQ